MTSISSLSSRVVPVPQLLKAPAPATIPTVASAAETPASAAMLPDKLQSMLAPAPAPLSWKLKSSDAITSLMTINYGSQSIFDRFGGLGAAALLRFNTDGSDYAQAVSQTTGDGADDGKTAYQITLNIKLSDGVAVKVNLESKANSLAIDVNSSGQLNAADRAALSKLAAGFQNAIDGMRNSSKLDFSGLLQYDSALVSSIDLQAKLEGGSVSAQTQTFHADRATRSFTSDGPDGKVKVSVDMRHLAAIGNAQQRQAGVDAYLKQFDEAGARGNANQGTLATFKTAFKQLTGSPADGAAFSVRPAGPQAINLSASDHALLSGLPDFTASITDTPVASNPMRPGEIDSFSYQVSQETTIGGRNQDNRSISQKQHAHLEASFHEALSSASPLALRNTKESQNYYYKHVSEDRVSDTEIGYREGIATGASTNVHIERSTQVLKYVMGILTEQSATPEVLDSRRDLLKQAHLG